MNVHHDFVPPPALRRLSELVATGEIHVWRVRAEACTEPLDLSCLSADELDRAGRFRMPGLRDAFVFAHSVQRHVLSKYLAVPPAEVEFSTEPYGKPVVRGGGIQFNLTHSGSAVLVVISSRFPVGIDLEDCTRRLDLTSLASACLNDADLHRFESLPVAERQGCLLQWWTRKEATLKAQGCGLQRDPRELMVSWPGTPFATGYFQDQGRGWVVIDLAMGDRWRAAVSVEGQVASLQGFCLGW